MIKLIVMTGASFGIGKDTALCLFITSMDQFELEEYYN